jgi:molybdopterin/thiamine biosynthesis adenylyltransferase
MLNLIYGLDSASWKVAHWVCGMLFLYTGRATQTCEMKITNPKLGPGVRLYERSQSQIQIGINPSTAVVVDKKVGKTIGRLLTGANSVADICGELVKDGHDLSSSKNFLNHLAELGLVESGPIAATHDHQNPVTEIQRLNLVRETSGDLDQINQRIGCEISIRGAGRLGMTVCLMLASAGFPNITVHDSTLISESDLTPWGASRIDIGIRRDVVARNLIERMIKGASAHKNSLRFRSHQKIEVILPDQRADFPWISAISADQFVATDTPHLFAATSTGTSLVSSVIDPGHTPCLRCLHLHRCDQDPQWPIIDLQVSQNPVIDSAGISLVLKTAMEVTRMILDWINQAELASSHLLKLGASLDAVETYPTFFHPSCGCRWDLTT